MKIPSIPNPYTAIAALLLVAAFVGVFMHLGYRWGHGTGVKSGERSAALELKSMREDRDDCIADRNDYSHAFAVCSESTGNLERAIDGLQAQHAINEANAEKLRGKVIAIDAESARDRVGLEARNRALVEACARDPECGEVLR